jgi:hypothetical protein
MSYPLYERMLRDERRRTAEMQEEFSRERRLRLALEAAVDELKEGISMGVRVNLRDLSASITRAEGLKRSVSVAQVSEIIGLLGAHWRAVPSEQMAAEIDAIVSRAGRWRLADAGGTLVARAGETRQTASVLHGDKRRS